jgi:hypothetical protein
MRRITGRIGILRIVENTIVEPKIGGLMPRRFDGQLRFQPRRVLYRAQFLPKCMSSLNTATFPNGSAAGLLLLHAPVLDHGERAGSARYRAFPPYSSIRGKLASAKVDHAPGPLRSDRHIETHQTLTDAAGFVAAFAGGHGSILAGR